MKKLIIGSMIAVEVVMFAAGAYILLDVHDIHVKVQEIQNDLDKTKITAVNAATYIDTRMGELQEQYMKINKKKKKAIQELHDEVIEMNRKYRGN